MRKYGKRLSEYLYYNRQLQLVRIPALKLESHPGESESQFQNRLADILRDRIAAAMKNIEARVKSKQLSLERHLVKARDKID